MIGQAGQKPGRSLVISYITRGDRRREGEACKARQGNVILACAEISMVCMGELHDSSRGRIRLAGRKRCARAVHLGCHGERRGGGAQDDRKREGEGDEMR